MSDDRAASADQPQLQPPAEGHPLAHAPSSSVHPAAEKRAQEQATAVAGPDGVLIIPSKLFVGALPPHTDDQQLRELFAPFGQVREARIQKDKFTGESRKFGFVIFDDIGGAAAAVDAHKRDPLLLDGRKINVTFAEAQDQARPGAARPSRYGPESRGREVYGGGGAYGGGRDGGYRGPDGRDRDVERQGREQALGGGGGGVGGRDASSKLFVGRVDNAISDAELSEYFSQFGQVAECIIMRERGGASKGFAFLHFADPAGQEACLRQKQHEVKGYPLFVDRSKPPRFTAGQGGGFPGPADRRDERAGAPGGFGADRRDDRGGYGGGMAPGGFGGRDDRGGYGAPPRDDRYGGARDAYPPARDAYPPRDAYDPRSAYPPAAYVDPYAAAPYAAARVDPYARAPVDPRYDARAPIADSRYPPIDPYARAPYAAAPAYDAPPRRDERTAAAPIARREDYYAPASSGAYPPSSSAYPPTASSYAAPPPASAAYPPAATPGYGARGGYADPYAPVAPAQGGGYYGSAGGYPAAPAGGYPPQQYR